MRTEVFLKVLDQIDICPRCGVNSPNVHRLDGTPTWIVRNDRPETIKWTTYICQKCSGPINVRAEQHSSGSSFWKIYVEPMAWQPSSTYPDQVSRYLQQANATLSSPDASIVMSASAVDASLKHRGLKEGALNRRLEAAVGENILTKEMVEWGHRVRLDANAVRHADTADSPTVEEAKRSFVFADRLAEILFYLPSLLPDANDNEPGQ